MSLLQGATLGGNENFSLDDDFDYVDVNANNIPTPLRPKNKLLTNIASPMTPIHTRSDSISQTFIMNISPLRDIKEDKFHEVETQLQTWIENSLGIKFAKKDSGLDVKLSPSLSDVASKKESSRNFYYNLENGLVLCKLLHHYFPSYIAFEKVHQFDQQLFSLSSDKAFNSNYLFNAKNNAALFLAGLRKVDGFPVDLLFTFEDVFLQKNKKLILCSLTQLHEKALFNKQQIKEIEKQVQEEQKLFEQFEEDLRSIQDDTTPISPIDHPELAKSIMDKLKRPSTETPEIEISTGLPTTSEARKPSPTTRALPPLPKKPQQPVSTPTETAVTELLNQIDSTTVEDNTDSTTKSIISVFTLPLVIVFVILLKLLKIFGKTKTN